MAKVTISTIGNLQNESSAIEVINDNFEAIQDAIEKTLSRDGTSPNALSSDLDVNEYRILNLPAPTTDTEPARHGDIQQYVDAAEAAQEAAETAQTAAETAQSGAETAEDGAESAKSDAEDALATFQSIWLGILADDPAGPHTTGAFYFNSTSNALRVWTVDEEFVQGYVVPDDFVADAPDDGSLYARQNEAWTSFTLDEFVESTDVNEIVVLDQTTYDGLTPDANTLYFIEEA